MKKLILSLALIAAVAGSAAGLTIENGPASGISRTNAVFTGTVTTNTTNATQGVTITKPQKRRSWN